MKTFLFSLILGLLTAASAQTAPRSYALEADASKVTFYYSLSGTSAEGVMPVARADISIDFQSLSRSQVSVTLNAAEARAGVIFATEALKSDGILNTDDHPLIQFRSTRVEKAGNGARVFGDVTIRGITRPMVLDAEIFRQQGTEAGDLSRLTVLLTGAINRSEFGATGYTGTVDDTVRLRILARLREK